MVELSSRCVLSVVFLKVLVLGLLVGCGTKGTETQLVLEETQLALEEEFENAGSVELVEVAALGSESGPLIGDPISVAVDQLGTVYVADRKRAFVWTLSPEGDSLDAIGRSGRGPGEFIRPSWVTVGPNDSLFVYDGGNRRVSVFGPSPDRAFVYSFPLHSSEGRSPSAIYVTLSGKLMARYTRPKNPNLGPSGHWIVQVDRRGRIVKDDLVRLPLRELHFEQPTPGYFRSVERPFGRTPVFASDSEGRVCYGWTDSLHVRCRSLHGPDRTAFKVDHEPLPVRPEEIEQQKKIWDAERLAMIEEAGWHDTYPAFEAMAIDTADRFWIQGAARVQSFDDTHPWYIINAAAGTFRSTTLPAGQKVQAATEEYVYTTLRPIRPEVWVYRVSDGS